MPTEGMSTPMDEKAKFAVAMRMGRAALGLNQQEFADLLGVAKSTIARNETLEMAMRADTLTAMVRVLREHGVEIDLFNPSESLHVSVSKEGLESAYSRLVDVNQRRSDRGKGRFLAPGKKALESKRAHLKPKRVDVPEKKK